MRELERISCHDFVEYGGYAWFSNWFYNGLFRVEIDTGKTIFLGHFEGETIYGKNIHWEIFKQDQTVYFCPKRGRHLHCYDLAEHSLYSIEIRGESEEFFTIQDIFLDENKVFCVPEQQNIPIRRIDLQSQKATKVNRKIEPQGKKISECREAFPAPKRAEELSLGYTNEFFWRQAANKKWYTFVPEGRHLLCYREEFDRIETIPLTLMNESELENYLDRVKAELIKNGTAMEKRITCGDFFKTIETEGICRKFIAPDQAKIGKAIWEAVKRKQVDPELKG
ncbi:MAG: hypothetical protein HFE84_06495 [Lachnospiraceae bacterium]|nr:hypothetical protein [Lachnospiraceae bacterium]